MKSIEINTYNNLLRTILLPVLLIVAIIVTIPASAQKKLSEGTLYYDIVINTGSEKPQEADFFDGATSVVYIKGNKSRTEMVSSLGTQSTIVDGDNAVTILKEYGEQKYMIKLTPADWVDANKKNQNISFTYDPSQTKTIQGYVCKKAIGKYADGTTFIAWYTTDLVPENKNYDPTTKGLPGVAMEYETTLGSMKVTYTVSRVSFAPVPASKFDLPKSGFRVLTYQESKGL